MIFGNSMPNPIKAIAGIIGIGIMPIIWAIVLHPFVIGVSAGIYIVYITPAKMNSNLRWFKHAVSGLCFQLRSEAN